MNAEGRPKGRPADSQAEHIGGSGYPRPIPSATKRNDVVETKVEGSLTLPFAPIREGLAGQDQEPPWLVRGYVAHEALTLLSGWPKVGKSTLLFALVAALQEGSL